MYFRVSLHDSMVHGCTYICTHMYRTLTTNDVHMQLNTTCMSLSEHLVATTNDLHMYTQLATLLHMCSLARESLRSIDTYVYVYEHHLKS